VTPETASGKKDTPPPTRTVPATTTAATSYSPPPPQPGGRPTQPSATAAPPSSDPPPPQPGPAPVAAATHISTTTTQLHPRAPPSQFSIPTPAQPYLPTKSTTLQSHTNTNPKVPNPHLGSRPPQHSPAEPGTSQSEPQRHSLEHPPGYAQNPYAAGSAAYEPQNQSFTGSDTQDRSDDGMWGDVKSWAGGVGEKLAAAESQAWKWAQGK
jgi:hypothetical protein